MDLFWLEETDIPDGYGFELFGIGHISVIVMVLSLAMTVALIYRRHNNLRKGILTAVSFLLPLTEIAKIIFLQKAGRFGIGHLPLHLCSLSIIIYPMYMLIRSGKIRDFLGDFSCLVLLPSGLGAILFPDWTMYPIISFMSLSSFAWHTLQITLPLCLCFSGEVSLKRGCILKSIIFLIMVTIPVYLFDRRFSCNYFFLQNPVPGPLEAVYLKFGTTGYLPALGILVVLIIFITYGVIRMITRKMACGRDLR